jgi:hypothetical protein
MMPSVHTGVAPQSTQTTGRNGLGKMVKDYPSKTSWFFCGLGMVGGYKSWLKREIIPKWPQDSG